MPGVKLTTQAYCKMLLHGAKYPHCAVNGLLVAEKQKPRKEHLPLGGPGAPHTLFVDCIPLFHGTLALAPMLEVALTLVSAGRPRVPRRSAGPSGVAGALAGGRPGAASRGRRWHLGPCRLGGCLRPGPGGQVPVVAATYLECPRGFKAKGFFVALSRGTGTPGAGLWVSLCGAWSGGH